MPGRCKIVVTVPEAAADRVRAALGAAGAGAAGAYTGVSFSSRGVGRFRPGPGAKPAIGEVGRDEAVDEERIEVACDRDRLPAVVAALRAAHPYEEPVIDVYALLDTP